MDELLVLDVFGRAAVPEGTADAEPEDLAPALEALCRRIVSGETTGAQTPKKPPARQDRAAVSALKFPDFPKEEPGRRMRFGLGVVGWAFRSAWVFFKRFPRWLRIISYIWIQLSGPGGVTIVNSNSVAPTLDGLTPGVYVFQLTATDNYGASATATVTITVASSSVGDSASNQPPVAIVGRDTTVYYPNGDTAILNGSASYAPGGTIASYSWTEVSGPSEVSITNSTSAVGMIAGMASGDYVFQLTVTGSNGDTASATMTVHVQSETRTSDVIQLYPNPVLLGQQVTITGSNGYTGQVKFLIFDMRGNNVKTIEMSKQAPYFTQTISVSGLARGVYVIRVQFYLNEKPQSLKLVVQ